MKKTVAILIPLLCSMLLVQAQVKKKPAAPSEVPPPVKADIRPLRSKVHSVARAGNNEILIRWAPSDEGAWSLGNKYGYAVERYTITRNGEIVDRKESNPVKMIFKPRPLEEWVAVIDSNDNAAVIAQALYGDDFDVEVADSSGIANLINQTEKLTQRYIMAMYAADQSFEAATYAGLAWRDKNVQPNERYFYRVYSLIPKSMRITDTALLYISPANRQPLPKPSMILPQFGDKTAVLSWDFDSYREYYTSYIIERSADSGKTFEPVTPRTVTKLNESNPGEGGGGILYIDELPENGQLYQYRIAGKTLFDEIGPYSDVVSGKGVKELPFMPHITGVTINENGGYDLHWEFEDSLTNLVKEFRINQSAAIAGPYTTQITGLDANMRSTEVNDLYGTNYYTITVIPKDGEPRTSQPYLLQPEDSIPPAVPQGFSAIIDTSGVVTLRWDANTEKDLAGYKIYKANVQGHEFAPVMDSLWHTNEFHDTVDIRNLNRKLYYAVRSVDHRYNQSEFSQIIEVVKPDVIPPTSPVISGFEVTEKGVRISWVNSSDEDVQVHRLYRRQLADTVADWSLMKEFTGNESEWTDEDGMPGFSYSYTLVAVDSSQLESKPAIPVTVSIPEKRVKAAVKKLEAQVDRSARTITLQWQPAAENGNVRRLELYRGQDKEPMSLYKQLPAAEQTFVDSDLRVNTKYRYGIRAVYESGKYSDFVIKQVIY